MTSSLGRLASWLTKWVSGKASDEDLGSRGERLAAEFLLARGYRILQRNLSIGDDEADLVALAPDGRTIVVVEVKTRTRDNSAPEAAINQRKQYRLARLASRMRKRRNFADKPIRFDVVAIIWPQSGDPSIRHTEGAFESPF
jgi:putative endonuclease